jgi:hypothetical protein
MPQQVDAELPGIIDVTKLVDEQRIAAFTIRHRGARHEEWSHDIGVDHETPSLGRHLPEACWLGHELFAHVFDAALGVVDENIEAAEAIKRHGHDAPAVFLFGHVGDDRSKDQTRPGAPASAAVRRDMPTIQS